eukprot:Protomagalhaensia_sp_Gyna_25__5465@NODE_71_length_5627_cov_26_770401_g53_i0_p5_GENE_NODE_71_length_5627_cov_26_770401_g53_i0NODE_71_length_5627_cov_26_770401_g53_i0_p5_ORF_typecomplete_len141_score7_61_NODE_71_length_5627_cov_26_770401_g53_i018292251
MCLNATIVYVNTANYVSIDSLSISLEPLFTCYKSMHSFNKDIEGVLFCISISTRTQTQGYITFTARCHLLLGSWSNPLLPIRIPPWHDLCMIQNSGSSHSPRMVPPFLRNLSNGLPGRNCDVGTSNGRLSFDIKFLTVWQ